MTRDTDDTVTMDVGLLYEGGFYFVDVTVNRAPYWRSDPCETEAEAQAMLDDFRTTMREVLPHVEEHQVTVLQ